MRIGGPASTRPEAILASAYIYIYINSDYIAGIPARLLAEVQAGGVSRRLSIKTPAVIAKLQFKPRVYALVNAGGALLRRLTTKSKPTPGVCVRIAELHVTEYADSAAKPDLLASGAMASFGLLTLSPLASVQFARALSDNPFACHAAQDSPTRDLNKYTYIYSRYTKTIKD